MKLLAKELRLKTLLPGLDENSFKNGQYFELGQDWQSISGGHAIPTDTLWFLIAQAASAKTIIADAPQIPIEAVAEEVERQFPGRWPNEFVVGARGPLFWINDGIDRVGCQVGDFGMIAYSDRAGKSFLPWSEILGRDFVRNFQANRIGSAAEGLWFDGRHYWRKGEDRRWRSRTKEDMIMWLKGQGLSARTSPKETISDAEKVLLAAQEANEVKAAAPIVHDAREMIIINGDKYLNISACKITQPAEHGEAEDFPWLHEFFQKVWDENHPVQRDCFLAWFQHFYLSALKGAPQQGHAVIIAGDPSRGKTFLNQRILGAAMGGFSDSTDFLMGRTNFNKADAEVALWAIDDTRGGSTWENHAAFTNAIKKHVANPQVRCEGKNANAFTIPWNGRIVVTCNTDKESFSILPAASSSILDKIMMFKWGSWQAPFLPNKGTESVVAKELPFFLAWLRDWKPPQELINVRNPRYHVWHYHHPEMLQETQDASPAARLTELLDIWIAESASANKKVSMWVTSSKLRKLLAEDPSARDALKEFSRNRMAAALENLGPDYVIRTRRNSRTTEYLINTGGNGSN
jgi:uncharacterized protein DUF5906